MDNIANVYICIKYIKWTNEDIVTMPVHVEKVRVLGSSLKCQKLLIDSMEVALLLEFMSKVSI